MPLRSGVLAIGLIGSTLAVSGLVAYAIVQVPTLRQHLGQYFTNTTARVQEEASLRRIAYSSEIAAAVVGSSLGLLANLLLVWGVLKNRRWFLVHWLLLHLFLVVLLFLTSILVFVVQLGLWKLLGLVPVLLALVTMHLWSKVYQLFCQLREALLEASGVGGCGVHPGLGGGMRHLPPPWDPQPHSGGPVQPQGVEFYPGDPMSRGMVERLRGLNMVCLPYEDQDSPYLANTGRPWERASHSYQRASSSSSSSIVPGLMEGQGQTGPSQPGAGASTETLSRESRTDSRLSPQQI